MSFIQMLKEGINLSNPITEEVNISDEDIQFSPKRSFQGERVLQVLTYISRQIYYYFKSKKIDVTEVQSLFIDDPSNPLLIISTNTPFKLGEAAPPRETFREIILHDYSNYDFVNVFGGTRREIVLKTYNRLMDIFYTLDSDAWKQPDEQISTIEKFPEMYGNPSKETIEDLKEISTISKFLIENGSQKINLLELVHVNRGIQKGIHLLISKQKQPRRQEKLTGYDKRVHAEIWLSEVHDIYNAPKSYLGGIKRPCATCAEQLKTHRGIRNETLISNIKRPGFFFPPTIRSYATDLNISKAEDMEPLSHIPRFLTAISEIQINNSNDLKNFMNGWGLSPDSESCFSLVIAYEEGGCFGTIKKENFLSKSFSEAYDRIVTLLKKKKQVTLVIGDTGNRSESTNSFILSSYL
ncbi:MAG: hypothetical protein LW832_08960 [Parachlamydia sp.]|jgi:hypothetical protein|nr:hypothetical protein [Parachlamydia sp.]